MDGFEACRLIHSICDVPILILTGLKEEQYVVRGLELGADEYLVKPVGILELTSRIRAVLRRSRRSRPANSLWLGDVEIDIEQRLVTKGGTPISLTPTEFRLLQALAEQAGRLCTHKYLLDRVWGPDWGDAIHYLRLYIGYLRQKLEDDSRRPQYILNEWGAGYRLLAETAVPVAVAQGSVS
jgi:two-component system KDP operon response regulator KdpE